MLTEQEFSNWLSRPNKTYLENLQFAIKAWQSAEFTLPTKYDIIINWMKDETPKQNDDNHIELLLNDLLQFFQLHAQPGLIALETKRNFVEMFLETTKNWSLKHPFKRQITELLRELIDFELFQDLYHSDYNLHTRLYCNIFEFYAYYLQQFKTNNLTFKIDNETVFFTSILKSLKENIKRASDIKGFGQNYDKHIVQSLIEVLLILQDEHSLCFMEEFSQMEQQICENLKENILLARIMNSDKLHINLILIECTIKNLGDDEAILCAFLKAFIIAKDFNKKDIQIDLTIAAYLFDVFRKYDVKLTNTTKSKFFPLLSTKLLELVHEYRFNYLYEILSLLCATLRYNPLLLEHKIIEIASIIMLQNKFDEISLFEEFLVLLMDMFKRLSRAENFVSNLLKHINNEQQIMNFDGKFQDDGPGPEKRKKLDLNIEKTTKITKLPKIEFNNYVKFILHDIHKSTTIKSNSDLKINDNFLFLKQYWPSNTVGVAFSKLISSLVSKPSLVIWKIINYRFKELIEKLQQTKEFNDESLFLLDLHAAMLCQYLNGCRLVEQAERFLKEINVQRQFTIDVLNKFGHLLLSCEHDMRTMNAFLECSFSMANFELLLVYYRPDGLDMAAVSANNLIENLHSYLDTEEWILIQQRVLNFGKLNCKFLFNRLLLQRIQANELLNKKRDKPLLSTLAIADVEQLEEIMKSPNSKWFIENLSRMEKLDIVRKLHDKLNTYEIFADDSESLEWLILILFERLIYTFADSKIANSSFLAQLRPEFIELMTDNISIGIDSSKYFKKLAIKLNAHNEGNAENKISAKRLPKELIEKTLNILQLLPLSYLQQQSKAIVFTLQLALYCDLKAAHSDDLAGKAFIIIKDVLQFDFHIPIFKTFSIITLMNMLPLAGCWEFYEFIFNCIKNEEKGSEQFLMSLIKMLSDAQNDKQLLEKYELRRLLLTAIKILSSMVGSSAKRIRNELTQFLNIYEKMIVQHFGTNIDAHNYKEENSEIDKKFVLETLGGFVPYAKSILHKDKKPDAIDVENQNLEIDENFRRICKIYIGHSMDYRNLNAIHLMNLVLNHHQIIHLNIDEIEFVFNGFWQQLIIDLHREDISNKNADDVIKLIIGHKTNEDFLVTMKKIETEMIENEDDKISVLRLLKLISKYSFSTIKGAIYNEQFKRITSKIILNLHKNEKQMFIDYNLINSLLKCQENFIQNKTIPVSIDTIDAILSFLKSINIKKFHIDDNNGSIFYKLHSNITDVCMALIKQRHIQLMDRIAEFLTIFTDLVQSIVGFRSERKKDTILLADELNELSGLCLKLEMLMRIIATHNVEVKRVAPFILTRLINSIVANKRPTTLYPKIKSYIDSICYDLIGVCDHRIGQFILRCSNEAARQLYEQYVTEYLKYHKFKGKV